MRWPTKGRCNHPTRHPWGEIRSFPHPRKQQIPSAYKPTRNTPALAPASPLEELPPHFQAGSPGKQQLSCTPAHTRVHVCPLTRSRSLQGCRQRPLPGRAAAPAFPCAVIYFTVVLFKGVTHLAGSQLPGPVPSPSPTATGTASFPHPLPFAGAGGHTQGCTRLRRCCLALGDVGDPWDNPPGTWSLLCFTLQRFMGLLGCLEPGHLGPLFAGGVLTSGLHPSLIHISPPKRGPPGPSGIWGCS